jgi:hypothetical protein
MEAPSLHASIVNAVRRCQGNEAPELSLMKPLYLVRVLGCSTIAGDWVGGYLSSGRCDAAVRPPERPVKNVRVVDCRDTGAPTKLGRRRTDMLAT